MSYTKPQLRAFDALPSDGAWVKTDKSNASAIDILRLYYRSFVETDYGHLGPRGARSRRARLTTIGVNAKKEIAS